MSRSTGKYKCLHTTCTQTRSKGDPFAEYNRMDALKEHVMRDHYGIIWRCETCGLFFHTIQSRSKHLSYNNTADHKDRRGSIANRDKANSFYCADCKRWFSSQKFFIFHQASKCELAIFEQLQLKYNAELSKAPRTEKRRNDKNGKFVFLSSYFRQQQILIPKRTNNSR